MKKIGSSEQKKQNKKLKEDIEKERDDKIIGNLGEKSVYSTILDLLEEQMGVEHTELSNSNGESFGARFSKGSLKVDLKWFNKNWAPNAKIKESPVDIVIAVNDEDRYFIEVKSTSYEKNPIFYLTSDEWRYMRTYRDKSILVRAYEVDSKKPRLEIFKDPFGMICKDLITFMKGGRFMFFEKEPMYSLKLMYTKEPPDDPDKLKSNKLYLYCSANNLITYKVKNSQGKVEKIEIKQGELAENENAIKTALNDPQEKQRLDKKDIDALFKITSKKGYIQDEHTLEDYRDDEIGCTIS